MRYANVCKICFSVEWTDGDRQRDREYRDNGNEKGGFGGRRWHVCGGCCAEVQMSSVPY
jgi:hypothetical protein